jgi:hypothetical protein
LPDTSETDTSDPWSATNKTYRNTVTNTDLQRSSDGHSTSLASLATAADAAADFPTNEPTLDDHYAKVNAMPPTSRRRGLLELERRRPRIYRECRRSAIAQTKRENMKTFREQDASQEIDRLSYQYAIRHYHPDLPQWIVKPMADAPPVRR